LHAEADAEVDELEEVDEDDLTHFVNRSTWVNQKRRDPAERNMSRANDRWTAEQTDAFYQGLRMIGTDFNLISQMVQGKNRRQVKAKYLREERLDPDRVRAAMSSHGAGVVPMDFDKFVKATGHDAEHFIDPETLQVELDQVKAAHLEEMERERLELAARRRNPIPPDPLDLAARAKRERRAKRAAVLRESEAEVVTVFTD